MKKLLFITFIVFSSLIINAQDILIMQSGEEIETKIVEVNPTQVKYTLYGDPEGPIYIVNRADAFMIKYADGSKDVLNQKSPMAVNENAEKAEKSIKEEDVRPSIRRRGFLFRPEVSGIMVYSDFLGKITDSKASKDLDVSFNFMYQRNYKISYGAGVSYNHTTVFGGYLPIYLNLRGYLRDRNLTPYYDVRAGYAICIKDNMIKPYNEPCYYIFEMKGMYLRGGFGLDFRNFSFGVNIGIVENHSRMYFYDNPGNHYLYNENNSLLKSEDKIEMFFGVNIGYNIQ